MVKAQPSRCAVCVAEVTQDQVRRQLQLPLAQLHQLAQLKLTPHSLLLKPLQWSPLVPLRPLCAWTCLVILAALGTMETMNVQTMTLTSGVLRMDTRWCMHKALRTTSAAHVAAVTGDPLPAPL